MSHVFDWSWWRKKKRKPVQPPDLPPVVPPTRPDIPVPPTPNPPVPEHDPLSMLDQHEFDFLQEINAYRRANKLNELIVVSTLNRASYLHSIDMGKRGYFSHDTPEGVRPSGRARAAGYPHAVGENLLAGNFATSTGKQALQRWQSSPGHNANMLNPRYVCIGIGRVEVTGSRYETYWTTMFGTKLP